MFVIPRAVSALLVLAVAACAPADVRTVQSSNAVVLPSPKRVVVEDFAISPEQVRLDTGVAPRLLRATGDTSAAAQQMQAAAATQAALADALRRKLLSYGLPVEPMAPETTLRPGTLLVQGQIVAVDQGNRTRRVLIGLGAGKSMVSADAQLYYVPDRGSSRFLRGFEGSADSGHMPGAAGTMGIGAAAGSVAASAAVSGVLHGGAELRRTGDEENAARLADGLARQIGAFAVEQGWIPAAAVR